MPRRSIYDRMYPATPSEPLRAPGGLTKIEREIFTTIVDANPPEHFRVSDTPLLINFVRACAEADEAATHLREEGRIIDGKVSPWRAVLTCAEKSMVALSHRLRLSPQGRAPVATTATTSGKLSSYYDMLDRLSWEKTSDDGAT
jgi:phage terminase small subunit